RQRRSDQVFCRDRGSRSWTVAIQISGLRFSELLHRALDQLLRVVELLEDQRNIHPWFSRKPLARAVHAVLPDECQRIRQEIERDGEPPAGGPHHRFVMLERVAMLVEDRHYLLSRGAPPPLADARVPRAPTPSGAGMAAGATSFLAGPTPARGRPRPSRPNALRGGHGRRRYFPPRGPHPRSRTPASLAPQRPQGRAWPQALLP